MGRASHPRPTLGLMGAYGVVGVGMFVVVSVVIEVDVSVVAPTGGSPRWGARPTRDPLWAPWAPLLIFSDSDYQKNKF